MTAPRGPRLTDEGKAMLESLGLPMPAPADVLPNRDVIAYASGVLASALDKVSIEEGRAMAADDLILNWTLGVQVEMSQHPITQEVLSRPVLMFNGWLGPFPSGNVVMTAIPVSLYEVDDGHLIALALDATRSLEAEYINSKPGLGIEPQVTAPTQLHGLSDA